MKYSLLCAVLPTVYLFTSPLLHAAAQGNTLHVQLDGTAAGDQFGHVVVGLGDIDSDGFGDLVVTAPYADPGGLLDAGAAYVYSGATGTLLYTFSGVGAGDGFGLSLANIGDANNDSFDDFTVGAPFADINGLTDNGATYTYSGATGLLIRRFQGFYNDGQHGRTVSWAGDMNFDGKMDLLASEPNAVPAHPGGPQGNVKIYSPHSGSAFAAYTYDRSFGDHVAGLGDINGDGVHEFLATNEDYGYWADTSFKIFRGDDGSYLLHLTDAGLPLPGPAFSFARLGDLDQDGFEDFALGSTDASTVGVHRGIVNLYSGLTMDPIRHFSGPNDNDNYGMSVVGNADLNGDGVLDFGFASGGAFLGATNRVRVHSGVNSNLLFEIPGADGFGSSLAFVADVDGDALADIAVGSPLASPGGLASAGSVSIYR